MPSAPEDRRRKEYRAILQAGGEVQYEAKTETNTTDQDEGEETKLATVALGSGDWDDAN